MTRSLRRMSLAVALLVSQSLPQVALLTLAITIAPRFAAVAEASMTFNPNQGLYCSLYHPNWGVTLTGAAPNSPVYFTEYKWNGSSWQVNWGPAYIGDTDGSGYLYWGTYGPNAFGHYFGEVEVGGDRSGPAIYTVTEC